MTTEYIYTYQYTREGATYKNCTTISIIPPANSDLVLLGIRMYFRGAVLVSIKKYREADSNGITVRKYN